MNIDTCVNMEFICILWSFFTIFLKQSYERGTHFDSNIEYPGTLSVLPRQTERVRRLDRPPGRPRNGVPESKKKKSSIDRV